MKTVSAVLLLALALAGCASTPHFEAYPEGKRSSSYPPPAHPSTPGGLQESGGDLYPRIVWPF